MQPPYRWPPLSLPPVPRSLWFSTAVIVVASVTIQKAYRAVRRDRERKLVTYLLATFGLGVLFLVLQSMYWIEFYLSIRNTVMQGPYLGGFFHPDGTARGPRGGGADPAGDRDSPGEAGAVFAEFPPGRAVCDDLLAFSGCGVDGGVFDDLFLKGGGGGRAR